MNEVAVAFLTVIAIIACTWAVVCSVLYLFRLERGRSPRPIPRFASNWNEQAGFELVVEQ